MFDRNDIVEAYYLFFCDYHEGQGSRKYERLSRMTRYYKPRMSLSLDTLSPNAKDIYQGLVERD